MSDDLDDMDTDALLAELELSMNASEITNLRHVRSFKQTRACALFSTTALRATCSFDHCSKVV
jgi:hypothetical protein